MKFLIISGANKKSIGVYIAKYFHSRGDEIWLCNRSLCKKDTERWHERRCDISSSDSVDVLLKDVKDLDMVLFMADSGTAFGDLEKVNELGIVDFVNAKIIGSLLVVKKILKKLKKQKKSIKLVWFAGRPYKNDKDLFLYSIANVAILDFVNQINFGFNKNISAYYLLTPLTMSPMGKMYMRNLGNRKENVVFSKPQKTLEKLLGIIENHTKPGLVGSLEIL